MTEFTEYLEAEVLAQYFENQSVYVALWSSNPANKPDETNEITGGGYSPVQLASGEIVRNVTGGPTRDESSVDISFGELDSSTDKQVEGVVLYDGADTSTANALAYDDDISESVGAGNNFQIPSGNLTIELD
jgi:hypothetical protein